MRIMETITKKKGLDLKTKSPYWFHTKSIENGEANMHFHIRVNKGSVIFFFHVGDATILMPGKYVEHTVRKGLNA